ncbi:MAG: hypothetical protein HN904_00710 [Victivallales bacterium]|nr:hypothetical protein [Victivallales bacterium]
MNHAFRSTWGALLWKEWRQQRLAALFLCVVSLAGYLGYCRTGSSGPEPAGWFVLLLLTAACLAANTFAAAGDDRDDAFLPSLPLARWRLLVVKYPVVLGLALLCLLPPALLLRPPLQDVFKSTWGRGAWMPLPPVIGMLLLATWTVAMVAALASQGLGGMGALFGTLAFGAAELLLLCIVGFGVLASAAGEAHFGFAQIACWTVPHLWLLCVWCRRRPPEPSRKRLGLFGLLLLSAPVLYGGAVLVYQRTWAGPEYWIEGKEGMVGCHGLPSPDGRSIALTVTRAGGSLAGFSSAAWLLDVDTGKTRRIGPRWRDCRPPDWGWVATIWSPDSSEFFLHSRSIFQLPGSTRKGYLKGVDEHIFRLLHGAVAETRRWPHSGTTIRWLGNGIRTAKTPNAWEFTNGKTGETTRCRHPSRDDPVDRKWHGATPHFLNEAIATMAIDGETEGARICRYWRTAPDLAQTKRRDYSLPDDMMVEEVRPTFSMDEKWLLLVSPRDLERPLWLLSLADGQCQPLPLPKGFLASNRSLFTPDCQLLLLPSFERLHVWNLPEGRWEPGVAIPKHARVNQGWSPYSVSPSRPWRVAFSCGAPVIVMVANLEEGTTTRAVAAPPFEGDAHSTAVRWLGNDRLVVGSHRPAKLWLLEADGSGGRQLLP